MSVADSEPVAVIEMAQTSGLTLVPPEQRNPMRATTYGTGQLLTAALDAGHRRIIVGVGGSATNDGGAGAAQAIGVRLTDADGGDIPFGAAGLLRLAHTDLLKRHAALGPTTLQVASDVSNPLTGSTGPAMTYAPQKGASPHQLPLLDAALARMADVVRRDLGVHLRELQGAGDAGGLAAGLFAGAKLCWGAELVADTLGLNAHLEGADVVVTGEGRIDWQTPYNKAPAEVAKRAAERGIPVIAIGGSLGQGASQMLKHGVSVLEACAGPEAPLPATTASARSALADAAERATRRWFGETPSSLPSR